MDYIKNHEIQLALHQEGTHVLQKIIQIFSEEERQLLTDVLCTNENVNILPEKINSFGMEGITQKISKEKEEEYESEKVSLSLKD